MSRSQGRMADELERAIQSYRYDIQRTEITSPAGATVSPGYEHDAISRPATSLVFGSGNKVERLSTIMSYSRVARLTERPKPPNGNHQAISTTIVTTTATDSKVSASTTPCIQEFKIAILKDCLPNSGRLQTFGRRYRNLVSRLIHEATATKKPNESLGGGDGESTTTSRKVVAIQWESPLDELRNREQTLGGFEIAFEIGVHNLAVALFNDEIWRRRGGEKVR